MKRKYQQNVFVSYILCLWVQFKFKVVTQPKTITVGYKIMYRNILFISLVILLVACKEKSTDANPDPIGNQAVNCLRIDMGMSSEELLGRVSVKKDVVDLELLKRVHLPENSSDCEIRDFVDVILYLSSNQDGYYQTDPQVGMIKAAISGREEDYLEYAKDWHSPARYILYALKESLNDKHKTLVFSNFTKIPWLIDVINEKGWAKEVAPQIIEFVTQQNGKVNYSYVRALANLNDPSLYDLMAKCFINGGMNRHITYSVLKNIESFDTLTPMKIIWESGEMNDLEADAFSYPLLMAGFAGPLDYLSRKLDDYSRNTAYKYNIDLMNAVIGKNLTKEKMIAWLEINRENLIFDTTQKIYKVISDDI